MIFKEKIILGVDPGTVVMGYGLVKMVNNQPELLQFGVIHLSKYKDQAEKLLKIYERISHVIAEYLPDEMALEAPFFGKNVQSMLKLGRAQGVAMAAALAKQIPITEYAPKKIKQAVTGNGNASKEQIAGILVKQFGLKEMPELFDATDAVAVALCHAYQQHSNTGKRKTWKTFLEENPERLNKPQLPKE